MIKSNLIQITLTDFVDFICKAGASKISQIKKLKRNQGPYSPMKDFYKPLREGIIELHKFEKDPSSLDAIVTGATDKKKQTAYPPIILGYRKFLCEECGKDVTWVKPPKSNSWAYRNLEIKVNPELGLAFGGNDHIIKLYFKKDRLSRDHALIINHLMQTVFGNGDTERILGVLDVRNSRLINAKPLSEELAALVEAEAVSFLSLYKNVSD